MSEFTYPAHVQYMIDFGLDPERISQDGFDSTGYWEFSGDGNEDWRMWPHGFDYGHFAGLILAYGFNVARKEEA